jgi:outer membrane immunogenic protein
METYMQQPKLSSICLAVITSALLLTSTAGFATNYKGEAGYKGEAMPAPCPQPLVLKDGFYLGAQALYDSYRTRVTSAATVVGAGAAVSSASTFSLASNGWGGGIFGGYGMYFNNLYYLAGELFVNGSSASQSDSTILTTAAGAASSTNGRVSVGASWGVSVLPGLKLNDSTLGYIRLGYEEAKIRGQQSFTTTVAGGATVAGNKNNWQSGFEYGVGIETAVYQNVSVRGEFDHTSYSSFSSNVSSFNPSDNQYNLGLIYHFA